jgi:hypothetical protein
MKRVVDVIDSETGQVLFSKPIDELKIFGSAVASLPKNDVTVTVITMGQARAPLGNDEAVNILGGEDAAKRFIRKVAGVTAEKPLEVNGVHSHGPNDRPAKIRVRLGEVAKPGQG